MNRHAQEPPDEQETSGTDSTQRRPSAVRSYGMAIGLALLFLLVVWAVMQVRGDGNLLRLFTRQDQTWAAMQARGSWRVGMDPSFPPFQSLNDAGEIVGYDVDLARRLAAQWELELEIVPLGFDSLLDALHAGRIDSVVSALPYDPRSTRDFVYSPPYFEAGIRLAVRPDSELAAHLQAAGLTQATTAAAESGADASAGTPTTAVAVEDFAAMLAGRRLAVEWGSMSDMVGRRLHRVDATVEVVPFETPAAAIAAAGGEAAASDSLDAGSDDSGPVDGLLIDNVSLRQAQGEGANLVAVGPPLEGNAYVIAMPIRATTLQEQLTSALAQLTQEGVLEELETRWFGPAPGQTD